MWRVKGGIDRSYFAVMFIYLLWSSTGVLRRFGFYTKTK